MELPKQIVLLGHRTLPFEDMDENTRLIVSVRRECLSLLRGKGGVAFDELRHGITAVSKPIDQGVTSEQHQIVYL